MNKKVVHGVYEVFGFTLHRFKNAVFIDCRSRILFDRDLRIGYFDFKLR